MIRIWIDDAGVLRLEARGELNPSMVMTAHERFYGEEWDAFLSIDRHLADYRGSVLGKVDAATVRTLAARNVEIARERSPLRIAVLVDPGLGYGLARMWEQHAEETGWPLAIFTDEDEAWRWLDSEETTSGS